MPQALRRITAPLAVIALLALSIATAPVAVAGQRIHVTGVVVGADTQDLGQMDATGNCDLSTECVFHWRDLKADEYVVGSPFLEGTSHGDLDLVFHYSCDPYPACDLIGGALHNAFTWEVNAGGGWTGTGAGVITGMLPDGGFVYHARATGSGWGDLAGWQLQVSKWVDPVTGAQLFDGWVTRTGT